MNQTGFHSQPKMPHLILNLNLQRHKLEQVNDLSRKASEQGDLEHGEISETISLTCPISMAGFRLVPTSITMSVRTF